MRPSYLHFPPRSWLQLRTWGLLLGASLLGCGAGPSPIQHQHFEGFTFLKVPESELRIGARHVSGEIIGSGTAAADLVVQRSLSKSVVSNASTSEAAIRGTILNWLGISVEVAKTHHVQVVFDGIETVRLKSPLVLEPIQHTEYIYAGLRVTGLKITADTTLITKLAAEGAYSIFKVNVNVNPASQRSSLEQVGEGLYVGYRLLKFGRMQFRQFEGTISSMFVNGFKYPAAAYFQPKNKTRWSWQLVAEFDAVNIKNCLETFYTSQIAAMSTEPLPKLFPGKIFYINYEHLSDLSNNSLSSAHLYNDESCSGTYTVRFHDLEAVDEILGEHTYTYANGQTWSYPLPRKIDTAEVAVIAATISSNEFYFELTQDWKKGRVVTTNGGPTPSGAMVLLEKVYPFSFIPGGTL